MSISQIISDIVILALYGFPLVVVFAFVFNPPFLRDLDPVTTALAVLAIDGALVAFFVWLHNRQRRQDSAVGKN
jgi:ABC-type multidrug transport system permease subunit